MLENYQAVQDLAGQAWPGVRDELLAILREGKFPGQDHVDIYLHEDMIDAAIEVADAHGYYRLVEQVVDAAWEHRPEWAIRACKQQAEPIIERGQSDRYHHAARWLEKARNAAQAGGTLDEYRAYIRGIIAQHSRKYKLVPMLEALLK